MTEMKSQESLVEEIKGNVRRDRERLEKLQDRILSSLERAPIDPDEQVDEVGPSTLAAVAEGVSRIADALTRSNSQLVEVAKLAARVAGAPGNDDFSDEQRGAIFAEIERAKHDQEPDA